MEEEIREILRDAAKKEVLEIEFGLLTIPESRCRQAMTAAFTQILDKMIESRVVLFDKDADTNAAKPMAARRRRGVAVPATCAIP
jgi:hypothetical protein